MQERVAGGETWLGKRSILFWALSLAVRVFSKADEYSFFSMNVVGIFMSFFFAIMMLLR